MRMMMAGVAALLASAAPAAAQKADSDAMCFVAVSTFMSIIADKQDLPPKMSDQTKMSVGFFVGRLNLRFPGDRLAPEIKAAKTTVFAMPLEEQKKLLSSCMETFLGDLSLTVQAAEK